jgi:hypothetical protein
MIEPRAALALQESLALVDQALGLCAQLETEHAAKSAEAERVYLEKVASLRPAFDAGLMATTLSQLEALSMIEPGTRVKLASQLAQEPNQALHLVQRLLSISSPAHQEGAAIDKSAGDHAPSSDPDGWGEVVRKGAA